MSSRWFIAVANSDKLLEDSAEKKLETPADKLLEAPAGKAPESPADKIDATAPSNGVPPVPVAA